MAVRPAGVRLARDRRGRCGSRTDTSVEHFFAQRGAVVDAQRCETCFSWRQLPGDDKPNCHLYPGLHASVSQSHRIGPFAANDVAAGLSHVVFAPTAKPDGWCRHWEPRDE